ncbi:YbjQ family protein [Candidatus Pacearchaeota archaeon]|nr:MAG: YbjQ family protein [Candidatus Pacearchaeota archaeon]
MIVTTTESVPGHVIASILGVVKGNTVRAKNIGRDFAASLKNIVGGEIKSYTSLLTQAREEAYNRMVNEAIELGADAVVNVRFMTSTVIGGAAEILAYGTAVKLAKSR